MALDVFTKTSASPYSLKYRAKGDGGDVQNVSKATLLDDCAPGPLRTFLSRRSTANGNWEDLQQNTPLLSVYITGIVIGSDVAVLAARFVDTDVLQVRVEGGNNYEWVLEIRFNHSTDR
jgi:hypothetical protein